MIDYFAGYSETGMPVLYKRFLDDTTQEVLMQAAILPSNTEELANVEDATIYDHINNLIEYMKTLSQSLYITPSGSNPRDGWAVIGWSELSRLNSLASEWWNYVEFREDAATTASIILNHTH